MVAISKNLPPPAEWTSGDFGQRPEDDAGSVEELGAEECDGSLAVAEG